MISKKEQRLKQKIDLQKKLVCLCIFKQGPLNIFRVSEVIIVAKTSGTNKI